MIANSLSITIAQRTRELATLRTLGASRRQVLNSILVEALVVGTLASIVGLFLGLGLAKGLFRLFDAVGFTLPNSGLVFATRTVIVALLVGILVTVDREPPAGDQSDPRAADRRGARRRDPARVALRAVQDARLDDPHAARFAALLYGLFGKHLGTTAVLLVDGPRCAARSSSASRCCRCASSGRSRGCSAGRRSASAVRRARSRRTTLDGTRSAPRRRPRR